MRAAVAIILAMTAHAQQRQTGRVEFEVVSVKPGDPDDPSSSRQTTPGGLRIRNFTLKSLVQSAYSLNDYQLEGGPKWLDSAKFSIDAKVPAGVRQDQIPLMMQAMLADRFMLEFHRVTRILPAYHLVVAKDGPKVQVANAADPRNGGSSNGPRQIRGWGLPMSSLANMLIGVVGAPVLDKTGLTEKYSFALEFAPVLGTPRDDETLPSLFAVLQAQLGLKLESVKGPVDVLVFDRVEKPAEN